ncbi:MAG TPA: phage holin family protein, partial [Candidatus Fournierella merdigallinarum]|nr:phage holin family protein [Candidatus Fournierella merdigallinarum]
LVMSNIPGVPIAYTTLLLPVVLVWYILTELGSVLENAAAMGAPAPEFLVNILAAAKEKVEVTAGEDTE